MDLMMTDAMEWLRKLAWPDYKCENCIGLREHGCFCNYYDCEAPCKLPSCWRQMLRKIHEWLVLM